MIYFRASSISEIMGDGKSGDGLSASAKTYLNGMAKEFAYGFREEITSKYMTKGTTCEQTSIDLYNSVFFTTHAKNEERRTNDFITGEPDIIVPRKKIIDIKTAWSLATFPATSAEVAAIAKKSGYDYQGAAYMWLFDEPEFEVAYCMISTPEELRKWDQAELHEVDHIDPALRITRAIFKRDATIEEKMQRKVAAAREYLSDVIEQIQIDHNY